MTNVTLQTVTRAARPRFRGRAGVRVLVTSEWTVLVGIVVLSSLGRAYAAFANATAVYFPDEYIYSQLARSISHGSLTIRGTPAHFPALLEPILASPFWLFGDANLAYRLTLVMHGIAISLAAVPVYLLARRLQATRWQCAAAAALTVVAPTMTWSAYVTADAIAYPLALGAVAVGVAALERPRARTQILFLTLSGLAAFARIQYVILPVAFLGAALIFERGHIVRAARRYAVTLLVIALPVAGGLVLGLHRLLGYYSSLLAFHISPLGLTHWMAIDSMLIAFATGAALAPIAVAGIAAGLRKRAPEADRAFSAVMVTFGGLVLLETAAYATNGSARFQERYLVALMGLLPVAFLVGLRALPRWRWLVVGLSAVLFVCVIRIPLTGYSAVDGKQDSPFLSAVFDAQRYIGVGNSGLLVAALGGAIIAATTAVAVFRPRFVGRVGFVLAGAALVLASLGANNDNLASARNAKANYLGTNPQWVDDARLGPVDVLLSPLSFPPTVLEQLFWNSSLNHIIALPGSNIVDEFGYAKGRIARDGRVVVRGVAATRPVLVDGYYTALTFQHARLVQQTRTAALWAPAGSVQASTMTVGRYFDGWYDRKTVVTIWPRSTGQRFGTLRFALTLPAGENPTIVDLRTPGKRPTTALVRPGHWTHVALPLEVTHPVQVEIVPRHDLLLGGRIVSVRGTTPHFVASGKRR